MENTSRPRTLPNELAELGLTESVVVDVLRDKKNGVATLNRLRTELDSQKKKEQDRKVAECSQLFPSLSQAFIRSVLSDNAWNVEVSVGPLVEAADALTRQAEAAKKAGAPPPAPVETKIRSTVSIAVPPHVELGESINVRYVVQEGVPQSTDWIALCPIEGQHASYTTYNWIDPSNLNGSIALVSPAVCGTYQCRYLTKHYEMLGASAPFRVGPVFELKSVIADSRIVVTWKQTFGAEHRRAWAGLYAEGAPAESYSEMLWTTGSQGEISFAKPIKPGTYEVRLFATGYVEAARSGFIAIAQIDSIVAMVSADLTKLEVTGEVKSNVDVTYCWVGVFEADAADKAYLESQYLTASKFKALLAIPPKRGKYEVRLFSGRGYDCRLATYSLVL